MPDEDSKPLRLEYLSEYRRLMGVDYRGPARRVHPPAVAWHLGYWISETGQDKDKNEWPDEWRKAFREFADSIQAGNGFSYDTPPPTAHRNSAPNPNLRHQAYHLHGHWRSLPVRITLDLHHEYITVSTIIELAHLVSDLDQGTGIPFKLARNINALRLELEQRHIVSSREPVGEKPERVREVRERLREPYQWIYINVWEEFYREVLRAPRADMKCRLGKIFADFRGFIASACNESPFFYEGAQPSETRRSLVPFSQSDSFLRAHAILPFMTADAESINEREEKELTITRLLDGRCIYASTLGAQHPESAGIAEQPLTYFILTKATSSWQTGRLVDSLHTLGCLRLAARLYLDEFIKAGDELHLLEKNIENMNPLTQNMAEANAISPAAATLHEIRKSIIGGLPYRVERSRYYRSQFKVLLNSLRIGRVGRIEGFQPYDELVERRFGSAYEFIDMIGTRFDRLEHQLSAFYQRVRTAEVARQTEKIRWLQEGAEQGFLLILTPYYLGSLLVHLLRPALPFLLRAVPRVWPALPQDQEIVFETGIFVLSALIGVLLLIISSRKRRRDETPKNRDGRPAKERNRG